MEKKTYEELEKQIIELKKLHKEELIVAKERAEESESHLNLVQSISKIGSWKFNTQTFDLIWSLEVYRIFELEDTPPEKLYEVYRGKIHPDDLPELDRLIKSAIETGVGFTYPHRVLCKDGSIKHVLGIHHPITNVDGKNIVIHGTVQDITDRKKAEAKINELNNILNQGQKLAHVGSWSFDLATQKIEWSDETFNIFGFDSKKGAPEFDAMVSRIHTDDRESFISAVDKAIVGTPYDIEHRIHLPNDEEKVLRAICKPVLGDNSEVVSLQGTTQDITASKIAEEQLKESIKMLDAFFLQSLDGFFFMMLDEPVEWNDSIDKEKTLEYVFSHQRITRVNDSMLEQYLATHEQFMNLTPNDLFADNLDYGKKLWREFFDAGKLHIETREKKFDGSDMFVEGDYVCMYDSENRITGHFGIQRDITDRKKAEEKLTKSLEKNDLLLRELNHRTKNNMQVISAMLSLQSLYSDNNEVKEIMDKAKNRISGMALVHEKLYQANDLSWIDLKDYIIDLVELLKGSLLSKNPNIEIVTNLDNTRINIDAAIPCGIIINELFTNAIKYGFPDNKEGVITIELINNGDETSISVANNGVGIPAGFDFKNTNSFGLNSMIMLAEHQLGGSITLETKGDTKFVLKFKEILKAERV